MTQYWDKRFMKHLENPKIICEVGARYGDESIKMSQIFPNSLILSFECNPITVLKCKEKFKNHNNIKFFDFGLGCEETVLPFYSYIQNNDGASSFFKRIDFNFTQKKTGDIKVRKLENVLKENNIESIDLLCMDVQGFELNVLKGCGEKLKNVKFVIMEEPNPVINKNFLPSNCYSKYINAPSPVEIKEFMKNNNFVEIERIPENYIEDNVMYKQK